jgi:hypothetical protein
MKPFSPCGNDCWGNGIRLLDEWGFLDPSEPRLDHLRLIPRRRSEGVWLLEVKRSSRRVPVSCGHARDTDPVLGRVNDTP